MAAGEGSISAGPVGTIALMFNGGEGSSQSWQGCQPDRTDGGGEGGKAKLVSGKRGGATPQAAARLHGRIRLAASSDGAGSQLFALVGNMQFELPSFKAHHHTAKLVPVDLSTIDHEKRDAAATIVVPLNPATHHSWIRDLRSMCVVCEMFARQGAAHLFGLIPRAAPSDRPSGLR